MQLTNGDKVSKWILWGANIVFLTYITIIGVFNPMILDDHCFIAQTHEMGILGGVKHIYLTWHGRFSPQFITNVIVVFYEKVGTTLPYLVVIIGMIIFSVYSILSRFTPGEGKARTELLVLISVSFFSITLLTTFDFSSFFWIAASTIHFAGPAFALFGFWLLVNTSKGVFTNIGIVVAFLYVGSSAEHFGAIILGILILGNIVTGIAPLRVLGLSPAHVGKWRLATTVCLLSFITMFLAPGNDVRRQYFPESSIINTFQVSFQTFPQLLKMILYKGLYLSIAFGVFFWFGSNFRTANRNKDLVKVLALLIVATLIFLYGVTLPTAYAVSALGPIRSLSYLSFILTGIMGAMGYLVGSWSTLSINGIKWVCLGVSMLFLANVTNKLKYLPDTVEYAKMERAQYDFFQQVEYQPGDTVKVSPLAFPAKNLLLTQELSPDPSFWVNECICDAYGFDYLSVTEE